jgi:ribosomal-protein-alanine N-acetyltransferase
MPIPTITTPNLTLRAFNPDDAELMHRILAGKDVLRYFPGTNAPTPEQVERMIESVLKHWEEKGYGLWAVELRQNGDLIGRCGLQLIADTAEVEIDFIIDRQYWGRGLATEVGKASLKYGFEELGLVAVVGIVHPENLAAKRVLEKLGMQFVEATEYFGMACYRYLVEFYSS